jgi:anti-sigma B factor antagonist
MAYTKEQKGKHTIVRAAVEMLDGSSAPDLKSAFIDLNKEHVNHIVLDLSHVKYADSSGLSAILVGHRLCRDTNGSFKLFGLKPAVLKIITIAQLNKVLDISENEEIALSQNIV